jgi:acetylornithine/N-succinyldiaminopimelate aminotransferase
MELSRKLVDLSGMDRVFFTNSGAESVEGAFKFARKYAHAHNKGGRIIAMNNCFHGRTLATIATGKKKYQQGFDPIPEGFSNVPMNNIRALEASIDKETAAVIIEPVQGEGGIHPANGDYLKQVRELCDENNILLIYDEIQCGMGRTGKLFAKDHYDVEPDIITLAKGLGGGVPIGAILMNEKVAETVDYGDHGTTFGGNPLVCAAANIAVDALSSDELMQEVFDKGKWFRDQINSWERDDIKEIRGLGLMIGVDFDFEAKPLVHEMMDRGVISNVTSDTVLRVVPPLTISKEELEQLVEVIQESLENLD